VAREDAASMDLIARAVQGEGEGRGRGAGADLLVCDMNRHPSEAAALLEAVSGAGLLAEGARVVLTLKMTVKGRAARAAMQAAALVRLGDQFVDKQVHHLFGNTGYETTVTAIFRSAATAATS
jgi:hypothetical protein